VTISLKSFQDRTVLITGGSSGIGLALARRLSEAGAHIWLMARRKPELESALARLNGAAGSHHIVDGDVSDWRRVAEAIAQVERESGLPDLVINSAGVTRPGYVQDLSIEIFREMMEINYLGTVHVVKAVLPGMIARSSGYIVNISSTAGLLGVFGYTAYGASKFAVRGFSDALRAEVKPLGIGSPLSIRRIPIPHSWLTRTNSNLPRQKRWRGMPECSLRIGWRMSFWVEYELVDT